MTSLHKECHFITNFFLKDFCNIYDKKIVLVSINFIRTIFIEMILHTNGLMKLLCSKNYFYNHKSI